MNWLWERAGQGLGPKAIVVLSAFGFPKVVQFMPVVCRQTNLNGLQQHVVWVWEHSRAPCKCHALYVAANMHARLSTLHKAHAEDCAVLI